MTPSGLLLIGKVGKAHGLHGQVRVQSYARSPESFVVGRKVILTRGDEVKTLSIANVRVQPRSLLLNFQGLEDRTRAEALNGFSLFIEKEDLDSLPEGEYYRHQLIGARVYNDLGRFLGIMEGIFTTPAHDVWVIRNGESEWLFPAVEDVVLSVNLSGGEIRVRDIYGSSENNDD
ncbi:MAG: ribosome maturation factor RimM [Thermodesulfobacteriota bacterium]